jgi:CBS domain-containing protein
MEHLLRYRTGSPLPPFAQATVADVMHVGIISCPPDADVATVARAMATHRMHAVVVDGIVSEEGGERLVWGIVSDLDLLAGMRAGEERPTAARLAGGEIVTIDPAEPLERAAQLMIDHKVHHLVVASSESGRPLGVISGLDLAAAIGWGTA